VADVGDIVDVINWGCDVEGIRVTHSGCEDTRLAARMLAASPG
jgi:hypothetical protein